MPMSTDDIIYEIRLGATANDADTLAGMNYLIDWTLPRTESDTKGFLAYFNGHHYNYRDHRLREYHWEWDSIPFITATGECSATGSLSTSFRAASPANCAAWRLTHHSPSPSMPTPS